MNKIKRVSLFFKIIFQILFILLPMLHVFFWIHAPVSFHFGNSVGFSFNSILRDTEILYHLDIKTKILGFIISLIPLVMSEIILYFLVKLFGLYAKGEIFLLENVKHIRNIGYALLLKEVLNPVYQGLITATLTWPNPHGHRTAAITLSGVDTAIIFMAIMIILVSWIMAEGYKLQEEQKYII